jgi:hypothetical protein
MSVGRGVGIPWGGAALTADTPETFIHNAPYTFDFTDEPDGDVPGSWEFYTYSVTGGVVTSTQEATPSTYFQISDGLGLWNYDRAPSAGDPYTERGAIAAPLGIVTGRNPRLSILFRSPTLLLDFSEDELVFELIGGVRSNNDADTFVGGQISAHWGTGVGWDVPLAVEAISSSGALPVGVLGAATLFEVNEDLDYWDTAAIHELEVTVIEGVLTVKLDGVHIVETAVTITDDVLPVVGARIYHLTSGTITPVAAIVGVQVSMARSSAKNVLPAPLIPGDISLETGTPPFIMLPLRDMIEQGALKRHGSHTFEFTDDYDTDVGGAMRTWNVGSRVRSLDRYNGEEFSRVVIDLAYERSKRVER